mmetsp:Transcript_20597/g.33952  ORF Transcript_20597/g.33952 Transcript_20597/m.33952 type:complete len:600 (+) Transcript_20597:196-1995(+)
MFRRLAAPIVILLCVPLFIATCSAHDKTIIAYYASWQIYDREGLAKPVNLDYSKFTRLNFAFFQPTTSGDIYGTDVWGDPMALFGDWDWSGTGQTKCHWAKPGEPPVCGQHHYHTGLIHLSHVNGVEVYPSIGGWTLSENFPPMAANPTARQNFAKNCAKLVQHYDFDGIDIDWEYPTYAAHGGGPDDTVNYNLLMQAIRDELDALGQANNRFYGLTAAMPCGPDLINGIDLGTMKDILTEFNLMTYDLHGSWSSKTGPNAPLFDFPGSPELSVHGCTENFLKGGVKKNQINVGLPFYGRSFLATLGSTLDGFDQAFAGAADLNTWADDEGTPQYFNIVKKLSQFTSVRHEQTKTQFAYDSIGLLSYDDELAICDKAEYAIDNDLLGFIIWEISGDILPDLSTPLLDSLNDRLNNPDTRCDGGSGGGAAQKPVETQAPVLTENPTQLPTRKPSFQPTKKPQPDTVDDGGQEIDSITQSATSEEGDSLFYPYFESDTAECRNDDGSKPDYIRQNMLSSESICCENYYFYDLVEECKTSSYTQKPFYPNFRENSCVNDGLHPEWMAGNYLEKNHWLCCHNFFSYNEKLLDACVGKLDCADC